MLEKRTVTAVAIFEHSEAVVSFCLFYSLFVYFIPFYSILFTLRQLSLFVYLSSLPGDSWE